VVMVDDAWVLAQFTLMMEEITSSTTVLTHLTRKAPRKIGVGAASVLSCAMLEKQVNALLVEFMIMELLANTGLIWKNTTIYLRKNGNWCCKCSSMFYGGSIGSSRCPSGGNHDKNGSGNYHIAYTDKPVKQQTQSSAGWQDKWGWCGKCQSLFFAGGSGGRCNATGQAHTNDGGNYKMAMGDTGFKGQEGWKWCNKCYCLCYSGLNAGACAAGSGHDFNGSGAYRLHMEAHTNVSQTGWNWCSGCQVAFYGPHMSSSRCVGGKAHSNNGSGNYHIAHH